MTGNNQSLFFSPEEKGRAFSDVLKEVQEYISSKYSTLMVEGGNEKMMKQAEDNKTAGQEVHRKICCRLPHYRKGKDQRAAYR